MAGYTDTDEMSDVANGDQDVTSPGAAFLNKKRKKSPLMVDRGSGDINQVAGAGADGASNGTAQSNTSKSTKPVVQEDSKPPIDVIPGQQPTQNVDKNASFVDKLGQDAMQGQKGVNHWDEARQKEVGPQPELADQGSKNPLLHFFQKKLGFVGDTPAPGEKYDGPATPEEKARHMAMLGTILHGVHDVGLTMSAAGGSNPERQQASEILNVDEPKMEMQKVVAQNEMHHRLENERQGQERVDVSQQRADTGDYRADLSAKNTQNTDLKTQAQLEQKGLTVDSTGKVRPKTADEYAQDPRLQNNLESQQATKELKYLEQEHMKAQTAALTDPNSLPAQQQEARLRTMLEAARTRAATIATTRQVQATDSQTGQETIVSMEDVNNNPGRYIPLPTGTTRTMNQMASSVEQAVPQLVGQINELKTSLGADVGRWKDLWINRLGMDDPKFAGLDQNLRLYASAVSRTHFGGSAPVEYTHALEKNFGEAQSPEDLLARIQSADTWISGYAKMSGRGGNPNQKGTTNNTPPPSPNKPPKVLNDASNSTKPVPKW